jgi:dTDP-4-dehydrorhamnose reductase
MVSTEFRRLEFRQLRIAVLGAKGQLGMTLVPLLLDKKYEVRAYSSTQLDIRSYERLSKELKEFLPDVIINCAAYTKVEEAESSQTLAYEVNVLGSRNIAVAARAMSCILVHISTDYVFSGFSSKPWHEGDETSPVNYYGKTKLLGELEILENHPSKSFIIRTSWLYSVFGRNFVRKISELVLYPGPKPIKVVNDQVGQPTSCIDLSMRLVEILSKKICFGVYHITNSGQTTWYELAKAISDSAGNESIKIFPIRSETFHSVVQRPKFSVLDNSKMLNAGLTPMPNWRTSLENELPKIFQLNHKGNDLIGN